jgi:hypothetical protein
MEILQQEASDEAFDVLEALIRQKENPADTVHLNLHLMNASGDPHYASHAECIRLINTALSMRLHTHGTPRFKPRTRQSKQCSGGPHSLGPFDVSFLARLAPRLKPAWVKAQLADVAVVAGRELGTTDWNLGRVAASAYLEASEAWVAEIGGADVLSWLQRGLSLAWQFGKDDIHPAMWKCSKDVLMKSIAIHHLGNAFGLAEEALARKDSWDIELGPVYESLAASLSGSQQGGPYWVSRSLDLAALFWEQTGNQAEEKRCKIEAATYFCTCASAPDCRAAVAADWLAEGILRLQRARADKEEIERLKRLLGDVRSRIVDDMAPFNFSIDTTDLAAHVRSAITSSDAFEALVQVAFHTSAGPRHDETRKTVMRNVADGSASTLFGSVQYNDHGEPVQKLPPLDISDEGRIYAEMVSNTARVWPMLLGGTIAPLASEIYNNRFSPSLGYFIDLTYYSTAVPAGHALSVAKGLLAGFTSDWHDVGAFLIPQVEPVVRHIFQKASVITVADKEGIIEEKGLETLLAEKGGEILGKDLTLMIRALLTDRSGAKLRHLYAHGLLPDDGMASREVASLWWMMLRIVLWPLIAGQRPIPS